MKMRSEKINIYRDSFTILGLWVLGLAVSNINESQLQTYESKTLFLMTSVQYYFIPGLAEIKTYAQKMQDAQVTKSLYILRHPLPHYSALHCAAFIHHLQLQHPVSTFGIEKILGSMKSLLAIQKMLVSPADFSTCPVGWAFWEESIVLSKIYS